MRRKKGMCVHMHIHVCVVDLLVYTCTHTHTHTHTHTYIPACVCMHTFRYLPQYQRHTPLYLASEGGHHKTVQLLLERGADPNRRDVVRVVCIRWCVEWLLFVHK